MLNIKFKTDTLKAKLSDPSLKREKIIRNKEKIKKAKNSWLKNFANLNKKNLDLLDA